MKVNGYKVVKIYVEGTEALCDIAIFGENSLMVDDLQLCEKVLERIPYKDRAEVGSQYGKELMLNFINDMLVIH